MPPRFIAALLSMMLVASCTKEAAGPGYLIFDGKELKYAPGDPRKARPTKKWQIALFQPDEQLPDWRNKSFSGFSSQPRHVIIGRSAEEAMRILKQGQEFQALRDEWCKNRNCFYPGGLYSNPVGPIAVYVSTNDLSDAIHDGVVRVWDDYQKIGHAWFTVGNWLSHEIRSKIHGEDRVAQEIRSPGINDKDESFLKAEMDRLEELVAEMNPDEMIWYHHNLWSIGSDAESDPKIFSLVVANLRGAQEMIAQIEEFEVGVGSVIASLRPGQAQDISTPSGFRLVHSEKGQMYWTRLPAQRVTDSTGTSYRTPLYLGVDRRFVKSGKGYAGAAVTVICAGQGKEGGEEVSPEIKSRGGIKYDLISSCEPTAIRVEVQKAKPIANGDEAGATGR